LDPLVRLIRGNAPVVVPDGAALRALNAALDQAARVDGAPTWQPPRVETWQGTLTQAFEHRLLAGDDMGAELLLSADQELALWQAVIAADDTPDLRAPERAAPLARAAWRVSALWALPTVSLAPYAPADLRAYARWAAAYRARADALGALDAAALLAKMAEHAACGPAATTQARGFLAPPPRLAAWLGAALDHEAPRVEANRFRAHAFPDREQELHAALDWARSRSLAEPRARVVVALDDLHTARELAWRCVRDVFGSDDACHVEALTPLVGEPAIAAALLVLDIAPVMRWDALSALLRHPAVAGAAEERGARSLLDAELRALERYELPLALVRETIARSESCPQLGHLLDAVLDEQARQPERQRLVDWLQHFERCLLAAGWPGAGGHVEQARQAWSEVCDRLYRLDTVLDVQTRAAALARLRRLLADTPRRLPGARHGVYLVAPTTALVLAPTHLWLAGCESQFLLGGARLSPLLPIDAQRAAGVPGAEPARDLWRARLIVETLAACGGEHHASFAAGDDEERFTPSPLIPALGTQPVTPPTCFVPRRWRVPAAATTLLEDARGPVPADAAVRGGVAVLAAHNACPFRAYARHRLAATVVEEPRPGMGARIKGIAVHRCLAALFETIDSHSALLALDDAARRDAVERAVQRGLEVEPFETALEREVYFVERRRLVELLLQWLTFEATRAPFTVAAREAPLEVTFGGLRLRVRLDRLDRLPDGSAVVVDYKTGRCAPADWQVPRMNEPQLPFYAVAAPLDGVRAVAFARVDRARPQWLQRPPADAGDEDGSAAAAWQSLAAEWAADLAASAAGILAGDARPAPKRGLTTCRNCEQSLACRLVEHAGAFGEDAEDSDDGGEDE